MTKRRRFVLSVPWPVRLFGGPTDFLRLPCIVVASDLRTMVGVRPREDGRISVSGPGVFPDTVFDPADARGMRTVPGLAQTADALREARIEISGGWEIILHTMLPQPERLLRSPVLTVAWTALLLALDGRIGDLSGNEIARLAHRAAGGADAGGVSEIYSCVLGGSLYVRHEEEPNARAIERTIPGLVWGNAGTVRRRTLDPVPRVAAALRAFRGVMEDFDLSRTPLDDVIPRLGELDDEDAGVVYAVLVNRDTCESARDLLDGEVGFDDDRLGEMLDRGHEMLRDYLGYAVPRVERLVGAAKEAGALGCRIGPDGDDFIAFAPGREQDIIAAVRRAGGEARAVAVSDGVRIEKVET